MTAFQVEILPLSLEILAFLSISFPVPLEIVPLLLEIFPIPLVIFELPLKIFELPGVFPVLPFHVGLQGFELLLLFLDFLLAHGKRLRAGFQVLLAADERVLPSTLLSFPVFAFLGEFRGTPLQVGGLDLEIASQSVSCFAVRLDFGLSRLEGFGPRGEFRLSGVQLGKPGIEIGRTPFQFRCLPSENGVAVFHVGGRLLQLLALSFKSRFLPIEFLHSTSPFQLEGFVLGGGISYASRLFIDLRFPFIQLQSAILELPFGRFAIGLPLPVLLLESMMQRFQLLSLDLKLLQLLA